MCATIASVTKPVTVMKNVTPSVTDEVTALRAEIVELRRLLVAARKLPMTGAERVRLHRQRRVEKCVKPD
jgi:hypothetical protein